MKTAPADPTAQPHLPFRIVDLDYVSLYVHDFAAAVSFYSQVLGAPRHTEGDGQLYGWPMGSTWLTVFPAGAGTHPGSNPRNAEFAIEVAAVAEVDALYDALIAAGAKNCWAPEDTRMCVSMRFACVDDPFGVRIDVYCPLGGPGGGSPDAG